MDFIRDALNRIDVIERFPIDLPDIGLTEALDIIIMAMLVYFVMRWIRRSHAWALMKGIIIFSLIAGLAFFANLVTVLWIVENAFAMGLVAILIIFQPEMRAALERLGKGVDLATGLAPSEARGHATGRLSAATITAIVTAVKTMMERCTGALICIEREVSLAEQEHSGNPVDSVISEELILTIFANRQPMHDGAMIIRNNRIVAAKCRLPLSTQTMDKTGTRHLAALGLSEVSDAMVVVVSEETGVLSLAMDGKMTRFLTDRQLTNILRTETIAKPNTKRRLRAWKTTPVKPPNPPPPPPQNSENE